jgi:hypothetical protein
LWLGLLLVMVGCGERRAVQVEVRDVALLLDGRIAAQVALRPKVRATFHSLTGTLTINGRQTAYVVQGLESGDVLRAKAERVVTVMIRPDLGQLGAGLMRGLLGQQTTVDFEGEASLVALGKRRVIPVRFHQTVGR